MAFLSSLVEQDVGRALANLGNLDQSVYKVSEKPRDKKKEAVRGRERSVCIT